MSHAHTELMIRTQDKIRSKLTNVRSKIINFQSNANVFNYFIKINVQTLFNGYHKPCLYCARVYIISFYVHDSTCVITQLTGRSFMVI